MTIIKPIVVFISFFSLVIMLEASTNKNLIELSTYNDSILIDMRYCTEMNATGKKIMRAPRCLMREKVAEALSKVQEELQKYDLSLVVWNAYESPKMRLQLEQLFDNSGIAIHCDEHAQGVAVDVTLAHGGELLPMPTDFDCLTNQVNRTCEDIPTYKKNNRKILEVVMTNNGFEGGEEWYHFVFVTRKPKLVLDIEI